jgi:protein-S-isoprenylcysteine O-methyltransferase Ste14
MSRLLSFAYGLVTYLFFFVTFSYAVGFVGNLLVPKSIDSGTPGPVGQAILGNVLLLAAFAIQHTIMARPAYKRWFGRLFSARIERNTFVLGTCLALCSIFAFWRPIEGVVWHVEAPALRAVLTAVYLSGWAIVFLSSLMIGHFELFGLKQAWLNLKGKILPEKGFRTPGFYRYMRHPIQTGFLIAFWATPTMTFGHLLFSVVTTTYIFLAVRFLEERDLIGEFGGRYERYRQEVSAYLPLRRAPEVSVRQPEPANS